MPHKDECLPIEFESWDEAGDYGEVQLYNAVFLEDFGPFKKGEKVDCLYISYIKAVVTDLNEPTKTVKIRVTPIEGTENVDLPKGETATSGSWGDLVSD